MSASLTPEMMFQPAAATLRAAAGLGNAARATQVAEQGETPGYLYPFPWWATSVRFCLALLLQKNMNKGRKKTGLNEGNGYQRKPRRGTKMHVEGRAGKRSSPEGRVEGTVRQERGHLAGKKQYHWRVITHFPIYHAFSPFFLQAHRCCLVPTQRDPDAASDT